MARFPVIERPCPLPRAEQRRLDGHCTRCSCAVQSLDGMDDAARVATMNSAGGPICVSYRLAAGLGAALLLSMASPGIAVADDAAETVTTPPVEYVDPLDDAGMLDLIFVGGVSRPDEATWVDDSALPELPMRPATPDDGA